SLLLKWETKDLARRLDEAGGLSDLARSRSVRALAEEPFRQSALRPLPEQALEAIFQIGRIETHRKGSVLIREGDVDRDVWVLLDGAVRITNQARTIDAQATEGAILGELALLGNVQRNATVRAERTTRALVLPAERLEALLGEFPGIGMS